MNAELLEPMTEETLAAALAQEDATDVAPEQETAGDPKAVVDDAGAAGAEAEADAKAAAEQAALSQAAENKDGEPKDEDPAANAASEEAEPEPEGEAPKAPRLGDLLETIEGLKPEHHEAINERVNQIVRDRVGKVNAKRDELKQQLESEQAAKTALEAKVKELESKGERRGANAPGDKFDQVPTIKAARAEQQKHATVYETAQEFLGQLDGGEEAVESVTGELKKLGVDLTGRPAAEIRRWLASARDKSLLKHNEATARVTSLVSAAEQNLAVNTQRWTQVAHTAVPALADAKSPEAREAQQFFQRFPALADDPVRDYAAAVWIEGKRIVDARLNPTKPAAKEPPLAPARQAKAKPAAVTLPSAAKPRPADGAKSARLAAAEKRYADTGSEKDLETLTAIEDEERPRRR